MKTRPVLCAVCSIELRWDAWIDRFVDSFRRTVSVTNGHHTHTPLEAVELQKELVSSGFRVAELRPMQRPRPIEYLVAIANMDDSLVIGGVQESADTIRSLVEPHRESA